jgi:predicted ATP-grasp superfamily ATP-dependent carboligase
LKKIKEIWSLIKFAIIAGVKILTDSMKKEAQTYKEEKEQQKKNKRMMNEKEKK